MLRRRPVVAEVQRSDDRGPRIDVGREQVGALREGVDEGTLAGLDLADHGDPAGLLLKDAPRLRHDRQGVRIDRDLEPLGELEQAPAHLLERRADATLQSRAVTGRRHRGNPHRRQWPFDKTHSHVLDTPTQPDY